MRADVVLKRDVQEELAWDPSIDATCVDVVVKNGVVTLTGRVNSYPEKQFAETAAKRVAGVQRVEEAIEVHLPPGLSKCKDSEISQVVQTILKWNVAVADDKVLFSVKNGWITLEGEVHWQYQKIALENALRYVRGVTGITSNIGIVPRAKVVQARTKIEAALLRNGGLDAHRIEVDADGGMVILSGMSSSWEVHQAAEQTAWALPGVRVVRNQLSLLAD